MVAKYRSQFLVCPRFKLLWSCSFNEVLPARPESPLICEATWTFLTSSLQKDFHYISEKREQKLLLQGENSKRAQQNMSFDVASLGKYTSLHTEPRCIPPQYTISRLAKKQKKTLRFTVYRNVQKTYSNGFILHKSVLVLQVRMFTRRPQEV